MHPDRITRPQIFLAPRGKYFSEGNVLGAATRPYAYAQIHPGKTADFRPCSRTPPLCIIFGTPRHTYPVRAYKYEGATAARRVWDSRSRLRSGSPLTSQVWRSALISDVVKKREMTPGQAYGELGFLSSAYRPRWACPCAMPVAIHTRG